MLEVDFAALFWRGDIFLAHFSYIFLRFVRDFGSTPHPAGSWLNEGLGDSWSGNFALKTLKKTKPEGPGVPGGHVRNCSHTINKVFQNWVVV